MKRITKKIAIIEGCDNIWSNAYDIREIIKALKHDISELQNNTKFNQLSEIIDEVLVISNNLICITRKDKLQLKDDEETTEEKTEE